MSRGPRGVTINSLLTGFAVALALAAIVAVNFVDSGSMIEQLQGNQLRVVAGAINEFKGTYARYPEPDEGVAVLWDKERLSSSSERDKWRLFLKDKVTSDHWGNPLVYTPAGTSGGVGGYELRSLGPDGRQGGGDDVVIAGGADLRQ